MATQENKNRQTIGSLKKRADFLRVQGNGDKWVTKSFIIRKMIQPSGILATPDIRFGLTITKKQFKNATDRNRVKRRLRSIASNLLPQIGDKNTDYVFIGRKETMDRDFTDLEKDLKWAIKRLSQEQS
jgi:ribonuclease P protein component